MYVNRNKKTKTFWTTIVLIIVLPLLVVAALIVTQYLSRAGQDATPVDVVMTNLTSASVSITWVSEVPSEPSLVYQALSGSGGVVSGSESTVLEFRGSGERYTHYFEITGLEPETEYEFYISAGGETYKDTSGNSFKFKTAPVSENIPPLNEALGKIKIMEPVNGETIIDLGDDGVVIIVADDGTNLSLPVSAPIRSGGNWIIDLSAARYTDTLGLFPITSETTLKILARGPQGTTLFTSGTKDELFDKNGMLKDTVTLELSVGTFNISELPSSSIIDSIVAQNIGGGGSEIPVEEEPIEEEPVEEEPVEEEPIEEEPVAQQDLKWGSLIMGESTQAQVTVPTYENSLEITNITDTKFSVIWVSSVEEIGYVRYGIVASGSATTTLTKEALDIRDSALEKSEYYTHHIELLQLIPESEYKIEIHSGDKILKNGIENLFSVTTFETLDTPPAFQTVSGVVSNYNAPADSIVRVLLVDKDGSGSSDESITITTVPNSNGTWIASIGDARTKDGADYFATTNQDVIESVVVAPVDADPVETAVLGIEDTIVNLSTKVSQLEVTSGKVSPLSFYGVYASLNDIYPDAVGGGDVSPTYDLPLGGGGSEGYTPKTGISGVWGIILVAGSLLFIGSTIFLNKKKKSIAKGSKMLDKF